MQQTIRLFGSVVNRHSSFYIIIAYLNEANANMIGNCITA